MGQEHTQNTTMFAPKFKARAPTGSGVWTPKSQTPYGSSNELDISSSAAPTPPPPPTQPVWTPQTSPALSGRKEFRPVRFESPTLPRRYTAQQQQQQQQQQQTTTTTIPPWSYTNGNCPVPAPRSSTATTTSLSTPTTLNSNNSDYAETDYSNQFGPVAASASVSDKIKTFERSASTSELYRPFARRQLSDTSRPVYRPNEVIYKVKHEYMSEPETESDRPRKMAQLGRRQYEGIGPVTNDGMPIILRSEVQEPHQHEWYKRLYQTIHKQKNGDDFVIRYKCPRARPSYKSNGYVSEPEPNYDSDYSTVKYRTPNPLRVQSVSSAVNVRNLNQDDKLYGTMPNPIKAAQNSYKNQPGRIENYTTGHSSVSEKEKKEWWDEVMDIFNGNLEQSKLSPLYTEGNLSRALAKESGYTSDSNLVFRKKELPVSSPLSPVEQRQAYKSLQAGGEPPLLGFRKPAPEKPKDFDSSAAPPIPPQPPLKGLANSNSSYEPYSPYSNGDQIDSGTDVNIHFKTPIRHEYKQNISEEELAIRQAEHMQKLYQEERRRKYLQELQDMNSRRHTDNFTPSQKSPIALNRYDDFPTDVTLKSLVGPKTVARALYNFQGQTSKELSFRKGDTIYIRRQIDPNWYEGEHNAMIGLLPASYVEIVSRDGARTPGKRPSEGQARAKYNFQAQSGVELSLNKGELVTLTRRVDGNWFEGKIANRKGIFPVSYVEVLTDIGAEDIAARTTTVINTQSTTNLRPNLDVLRTNINNEFNTLTQNGAHPPNGILKETRTLHKTDALHVDTSSEPLTYRALYKYRPQNSDELEIFEGDLVQVLEKCDDGWFVGTSQRTGCFGTFPGNYVERA
ncbi:sorbin and SH3 domain-containing protein 1 isoform X6 [Drosophila novamexicana]|uniref:sorbin and SH3 domain-containing protein 1 isoform X6 n=1 Tax=Drosophila novamexicana TaxID=47314 RepID=UPI0011E5BE12|nr:sorbin and SH3 domain-containing protein 1 isoform X6 [Drosophila novamexicana]